MKSRHKELEPQLGLLLHGARQAIISTPMQRASAHLFHGRVEDTGDLTKCQDLDSGLIIDLFPWIQRAFIDMSSI